MSSAVLNLLIYFFYTYFLFGWTLSHFFYLFFFTKRFFYFLKTFPGKMKYVPGMPLIISAHIKSLRVPPLTCTHTHTWSFYLQAALMKTITVHHCWVQNGSVRGLNPQRSQKSLQAAVFFTAFQANDGPFFIQHFS